MNKIIIVLSMLSLMACSTSPDKFIPRSTVMITNLMENSGGSGTIVATTDQNSYILTNAHVCGVVKAGGLIKNISGQKFVVSAFKVSKRHDLCLIEASGNAGPIAKISPEAPEMFDVVTVSGHPHLSPTIITRGHFSSKRVVSVVIGTRACSAADMSNPESAFLCAIMGLMPIIQTYDAIQVSALIQPGSSGSAVYGEDNKISAVIFAGSSDLGFGLAVPHEYVVGFLFNELESLPVVLPSTRVGEAVPQSSMTKDVLDQISEICSEHPEKTLCKKFNETTDMVQR